MADNDINVVDVVNYLTRAFAKATNKASNALGNKAVRVKHKNGQTESTALYQLQVEFCYLVDNIQRSPKYIVPKYIQQANEFISDIEAMASK